MLSKVYLITQKAVKISKFLSLVAKTVEYFNTTGLEMGVFSNPNEAKQKPVFVDEFQNVTENAEQK